jgi:hypothetical protein
MLIGLPVLAVLYDFRKGGESAMLMPQALRSQQPAPDKHE